MPIIGATDKDSVDIRYAPIGRLNKGEPKGQDSPGKELEYFRFTGRSPEITQVFHSAFGDQPKSLVAYLPYTTVNENFPTWIECWQGRRMLWRSDGRRSVQRWIPDRKSYSRREVDQLDHANLDVPPRCAARWQGRLNLFFPQMLEAGYPGTVTLLTTGKGDCVRITRELYALAQDCVHRQEGIKYIEVRVWREAVKKLTPEGKTYTHYDVFLETAADWVRKRLLEARQEMSRNALPDGKEITINPDTGEILDGKPAERIVQDKVPHQADASPAPVQRKADPAPKAGTSQGKVKLALFKAKQWPARARKFCEVHPHYQNVGHLALAVGVEGFAEVTDDNLDEVFAALERRAAEYETPEVGPNAGVEAVAEFETVWPDEIPF